MNDGGHSVFAQAHAIGEQPEGRATQSYVGIKSQRPIELSCRPAGQAPASANTTTPPDTCDWTHRPDGHVSAAQEPVPLDVADAVDVDLADPVDVDVADAVDVDPLDVADPEDEDEASPDGFFGGALDPQPIARHASTATATAAPALRATFKAPPGDTTGRSTRWC
jgi:hypothetical protein